MLFKHTLYYGRFFSADNESGGGAGASSSDGEGNEGDDSGSEGGSDDADDNSDGEDVTGLKNSLKAVRGEKKTLKEQLDAVTQERDQLKTAADKAKNKANEESGNWEQIAKDREAEIAQLKDDLAKRDLNELKRKVGKHKDFNLPDKPIDRLQGTTEEELRADAKELAAHVAQKNGPDTDSGKGGGSGQKSLKKSSVLETFEFGKRG